MKKNNNQNDSGITLVALIITIVIMLIIAGVSINIGTDSLDSTRLRGFYMQLELVQKRVDDIATTNESYVDAEGNVISLKEDTGRTLTSTQVIALEDILRSQNIAVQANNFKYFTVNELENILSIRDVEYNMFINFEDRIVVAEEGITLDNKTYYALEDTTYFVEHIDKNAGVIESLNYGNPIEYGEGKCKISITQEKPIGDLDGTGTIKYKKVASKYWETTTDTEIVLEVDEEYNIKYIDLNNNSIEQIIKVEYIENTEGNKILTVNFQNESEEI